MQTMAREKAAFAKAAGGDPSYRTQEFCLRMKGMTCECARCVQNTSMSLRPGSRLSTRPDDFVPMRQLPTLGQDYDRVPFYDNIGAEVIDEVHEEAEARQKSSRYESRIILQATMK